MQLSIKEIQNYHQKLRSCSGNREACRKNICGDMGRFSKVLNGLAEMHTSSSQEIYKSFLAYMPDVQRACGISSCNGRCYSPIGTEGSRACICPPNRR